MIDTHTHCNSSFDCDEPIENMCKQALKLHLAAYGITDHCEVNRFFPDLFYGKLENKNDHYNFQVDYENSMKQISEMKKQFPDLNLLCGIELGQATYDLSISERIFNDHRLDYIICSIHELPPLIDFYYLDYSNLDPNELLENYFKEILALTEWGKFNILAHLTYPLQFMQDLGNTPIIEKYKDIILAIFRNMVEKNIALEINCCLAYDGLCDTLPGYDLIKMFHDCGGKYVALGSDAHCADDVGYGIKKGIEYVKKAGFKGAVYFKNRNPVFCQFP